MRRAIEAIRREAVELKKKLREEFEQAQRVTDKVGATVASYRDGKLQILRLPEGAAASADLHRDLTELRDQVQELRKEVGQLRTMIEKK